MSPAEVGGLVILLLFVLFGLGVEVGFAMAIAGGTGFAIMVNTDAALNMMAKDIFSVFSSYGFTVIPLFVLMGQIGAVGGIARSLYESAYRFLGHVPGGLAMGTVAAATAFKAICGSSPATAATLVITMGGLVGMHLTGSDRDLITNFLLFEVAATATGLGLGIVVSRRVQAERDRARGALRRQEHAGGADPAAKRGEVS